MLSYHTCPLASEEGKETGGMNVYVLELSKELVKQGHQVDIFTRCQDATNQRIVEIMPGLRLMHLLAGPPMGLPKQQLLMYLDEFVDRWQQFVAEFDVTYDAIHAHYYQSGMIAQKIVQLHPGLPIVTTFHTLALMKNLVARNQQEQESEARINAEYSLVATSQAIIAPSRTDKSYLEHLYNAQPARVQVVTPGVNIDLFKPMDHVAAKQSIGAEPDEKILLFVGRIEPLKGIDAIMYALKMIRHRQPNWNIRLWIVGGDISQPSDQWSAELQKLQRLREVLKIPDLVHFVGQQHQLSLPAYYNAASVVVMPSHYESFGMTALEAMACGVPVVTTNVSGIATFFDNDADHLVATVNNPLRLSEQIEHLIDEADHHPELTAELRRTAEHLAWPKVAEQVAAVYDQVSSASN